MPSANYSFTYEVHTDDTALTPDDLQLLQAARKITLSAYSVYSGFSVGAAAQLANGEIVLGTNQENASYPVGICAERSLLAAAGSSFPGIAIMAMAISYVNHRVMASSDQPLSPCGMCRQALLEFENRTRQPMRLILAGQAGPVYIIRSAQDLLPLAYTGKELQAPTQ